MLLAQLSAVTTNFTPLPQQIMYKYGKTKETNGLQLNLLITYMELIITMLIFQTIIWLLQLELPMLIFMKLDHGRRKALSMQLVTPYSVNFLEMINTLPYQLKMLYTSMK